MIIWNGFEVIGFALVAMCMAIFLVPYWLRMGRDYVQKKINKKD